MRTRNIICTIAMALPLQVAGASLAGDSVTITHWFPQRNVIFEDRIVVFNVSVGEIELPNSFGGVMTVDVEDASVSITANPFNYDSGVGPEPCNCLVLSDLDWPNVNGQIVDLGLMRSLFFQAPGPSGSTDICD